MVVRVAIAGCTGYVGGELLRLLSGHPEVEIGSLTARDSAGSLLGEHHRHLVALAGRQVAPTNIETLAGHDVVFLALPHGASADIAADLPDETLVIDCGADFRLSSAQEWHEFYGTEYAGVWPYGLPELPGQREVLASTKRIAVPGCYPTNITLTLMPALLAGMIDGHDITVAAASGSSGAGKSPVANLLGAELSGSMGAYGVGGRHRHMPEILQNLRVLGAQNPSVSFTPLLAPMSRGIISVCTAPLDDLGADAQEVYTAIYSDEPFVTVLPVGQWPTTKSVQASNGVHIAVTVDKRAGRLVAIGVIDNLTKGTAGGAIQSMNLALGMPETTGLNLIGVIP